jgi:hypothetical protein
MRLSVALACLLVSGCVGSHSSGGLWALQNVEQEAVLSRTSDAQRAAQAHAFELQLADEALAAERARIEAAVKDCPGTTRQALTLSPGDRMRDAVRLRVQDDQPRLAALAQVALADWRMRRGRATGEVRLCDAAQAGLTGAATPSTAPSNVLSRLGPATVTRDAARPLPTASAASTAEGLSSYALGVVDALTAPSPLPQYLAAVYGGVVASRVAPALTGQSAEALVDELAPAYPGWEPDAVYEALRQQ